MSEPAGLARLQGWMQAVVTHPCCAADGLASEAALAHYAAEDAPLLVKEGRGMTAADRLGIYQGMYPLRMFDALAADYPMLRKLLGDETFGDLVRGYVQDHPSRSYTLNRLGDRLPEFASGWGPPRGRALRADLAKLELAMTEAFDAEEAAPLAPEAVAAVPAEAWGAARLVPIPALRLVAMGTNALAVFEALREDDTPPPSRRGRHFAVVSRRDYGVRRRAASAAEFALLADVAAGRPLGEAVERLSRKHRALPPDAIAAWTRGWIEGGLFAAVVVNDGR